MGGGGMDYHITNNEGVNMKLKCHIKGINMYECFNHKTVFKPCSVILSQCEKIINEMMVF